MSVVNVSKALERDSNDSVNNYNMNITGDTSDIDDYSNADPSGYYGNISLRYFAASPV